MLGLFLWQARRQIRTLINWAMMSVVMVLFAKTKRTILLAHQRPAESGKIHTPGMKSAPDNIFGNVEMQSECLLRRFPRCNRLQIFLSKLVRIAGLAGYSTDLNACFERGR
jgi:hypothetical protein